MDSSTRLMVKKNQLGVVCCQAQQGDVDQMSKSVVADAPRAARALVMDTSESSAATRTWFSRSQAEQFSQIKVGRVITVKGVFNGEAGLDLKLCRLVKAE